MSVDSFKFLPRIISAFYQTTEIEDYGSIPWTPLTKPLSECKLSLVTTGGIYHHPNQEPFDIEKEKLEPTWGDPSYRTLPSSMPQDQIGVSHLHLNPAPILDDVNVLLPIHRIPVLVDEGRIGALADNVYSFMGFQGFPPDTEAWQSKYGPDIARQMKQDEVDCVLLTPA